jgi:hypothetical protein
MASLVCQIRSHSSSRVSVEGGKTEAAPFLLKRSLIGVFAALLGAVSARSFFGRRNYSLLVQTRIRFFRVCDTPLDADGRARLCRIKARRPNYSSS